jgi:hypothetical protein
MADAELARALQTVRDALNASVKREQPARAEEDRLFAALDLVDAAALAPRTVPEAEELVRVAGEEREAAYRFLRAWTDWGEQLVPHPRPNTYWDSSTLRARIGDVVVAARDWSPYCPTVNLANVGLSDMAAWRLSRAVDALKEVRP